jgi:ABC-type transporter Mla subunit MlaD
MEVHEAEGLSKDAARELAVANQRLDRGLSSLNDNFETWTKSLKNTSKDSAEYAKTISELRKSFADLLNIADANELSLDWIEKWVNNAEEMAKILDGDTEAIQRFRESAFAEMTTNVFEDVKESLVDLLDTLNNTEDPKMFEDLQKLFN